MARDDDRLPINPDDRTRHPQLGWKVRPWLWYLFWGLLAVVVVAKCANDLRTPRP